jgi:uncharacterized protein YggT (Ycf19 family)
MDFIAFPLYIFLELLKWLIFIEILLSWLSLTGILIAIPFINSIIQPMFDGIAKALPTRFMGLDFSAMLLLFSIYIVQGMLVSVAPIIRVYLPSLSIL